MKKAFFLLHFLTVVGMTTATSAFAQTDPPKGIISGNITDEKKQPAAYATVSLLRAKDSVSIKGSLTGDDGLFSFDKIPPGSYLVSITEIGYYKKIIGPFIIQPSQEICSVGNILLQKNIKELKEVTVVTQKPLVERQVDKTVLNIANSALATGNSALEILQKAPGVSVDKDGNVSLRGKKGVALMLDGKPTYLSADQLMSLLRSTEGNAIQTIELITNPSSKYDAAGNSGIINIRLKKNKMFGTNGSLTAGAGYGSYYKSSAGITLNHREKTFNIFGNYNFSNNKTFDDLDVDRINAASTGNTYFNQVSKTIRKRTNNSYKIGLDYFINNKNTLGFAVNGYVNNGNTSTLNNTLIGSSPAQTDSSVLAENPGKNRFSGISYNLNYNAVLDSLGQELSLDLDFSKFNSSVQNVYNNNFLDGSGQAYKPSSIFRNSAPSVIKVWAGKLDYTYLFNPKLKLETGAKSSYVSTDNDFRFENLIDGAYRNDETRSNYFVYQENINALYANLRKEFKATTVQVGLRAEQTNSKGNSITENKIVDRHYLNLFPTLFINQVLSKNNEMGFSYSRRIDRPDYQSLNPFIYFIDFYTFLEGNPFLNPQYTNSFELSYSYKKRLNVSLGYSHTTGVITQVLLTDTVKKTLFQTTQNLAQQSFYSLNINYPLNLASWWTVNNNLAVYYNDFKSPNLLGAPYHSGKLAYQYNMNQTISINTATRVELSGNYQSAQVYGTYAVKPMYVVDLGISRSFADNKANIKIAANDIFNIRKMRISSAIPTQNYKLFEKEESQVFRLAFSYRFGSNEVKGANQRVKGSSSEENRVRKGN
ncbi:outer membrane beta-barrel family protein [Mucilaginibacter gossypii]|uniref:outer membrane beta-barrel family protein n=1 Tax=Mucilaginibacter gossypii TaxID=551996 RepID=UPI00101A7478|nr:MULTISPECIES: outer membrane beta-barrel family protein [Mucilaginibacter]QTE39751.1 outer membrane beta-barrel family protein [Mucilaginibacter gossypii]